MNRASIIYAPLWGCFGWWWTYEHVLNGGWQPAKQETANMRNARKLGMSSLYGRANNETQK